MKKQSIQQLLYALLLVAGLGLYSHAQTGSLNVSMATTPACSLDGSATATVTNGVPPYTYTWFGPTIHITGPSNTLTGVPGGQYSVWVTDANQAYGAASFTIAKPFNPTMAFTSDVCNSGVGTATVTVTGGTGPFSYLWSNGQTTANATGLSVGNYEITITDQGTGCYITSQMDSSLYAYIGNSSPITGSMSATGSTCSDGTATVANLAGGTAPYTYVWSTTPPQYTATVTGLTAGGYFCTVTDAGGCTYSGYAYVNQLPNGLTGNITSTAETCLQSNGTATVSVSGGTAPYTYLWSNGATTPTVTGLSYGGYSVTVTDANACPKVKYVTVHRIEPLNLSLAGTPPSCGSTNGSVTCTVSGGAAPYTYLWSNGATTPTVTGLGNGYHTVHVTDANGCVDYKYIHLDNSNACLASISGTVFGDMNNNCIQDFGDFPVRNVLVDVNGQWATTNLYGMYQEYVPAGSAVISQASTPSYFAVACPITNNITLPVTVAGSSYTGNDFYDQATSAVNDLVVYYYETPARATTPQQVTIFYYNYGSTTLNATVNFTHDALMSLLWGGTMSSYNLGTRTLTYNVGTLHPGQSGYVNCSFTIPTNTPLGTAYAHSAEILPVTLDFSPANNVSSIPAMTVAAYDPNAKSVLPAGLLTPGTDSLLTYTIEFQNTGNDTAFTVAIRDSLDPSLDPFSIQILGSSHSYIWEIDAPGYMEFRFENIMLPDSHINEAASHGFITYSAKLKPNLALGTHIYNTAHIYFDYNTPIVTNTTDNTFGPVAVDPANGYDAGFSLYPNPSHDFVKVSLDDNWDGPTTVTVLDLNGRALMQQSLVPSTDRSTQLDLHDLPSGIYLVECTNGDHRQVKKLLLQ